jgi:hypothetical protein
MTPYPDPQRPNYNNGKIHRDHIQARSLDGPDTPTNIQDLAAETNIRKGGHEGALKRYEQYLIRNGMSPQDARKVIQSEIDSSECHRLRDQPIQVFWITCLRIRLTKGIRFRS